MAINITVWLEHETMTAGEKAYMKYGGVSFSPCSSYMTPLEYKEKVFAFAHKSKALGGYMDEYILRFEAVSDAHKNFLNSSINLTVFETMKEELQNENLREAIYNILKQLYEGMRNLESNTPVVPTDEMIIRAQMRFMVDRYGIEAFARALKVFESERLR